MTRKNVRAFFANLRQRLVPVEFRIAEPWALNGLQDGEQSLAAESATPKAVLPSPRKISCAC